MSKALCRVATAIASAPRAGGGERDEGKKEGRKNKQLIVCARLNLRTRPRTRQRASAEKAQRRLALAGERLSAPPLLAGQWLGTSRAEARRTVAARVALASSQSSFGGPEGRRPASVGAVRLSACSRSLLRASRPPRLLSVGTEHREREVTNACALAAVGA